MLPIRTIMAPTDFSDVSRETIGTACELAEHFAAELVVVHVVPPIPALPSDPHYNFEVPAYQDALDENARRQLKETLQGKICSKIPTRSMIAHGDPAGEIVRLAEEENVDLIVIATHGLTGWQHLIFGSVAEKVVRTAKCGVLTVRGPRVG